MNPVNPRRGYLLGLSAYLIWGLFPLYFKAIEQIPAMEIIVHRVVWSAIFGALLLWLWKHPGWWTELRSNPRRSLGSSLRRLLRRRCLLLWDSIVFLRRIRRRNNNSRMRWPATIGRNRIPAMIRLPRLLHNNRLLRRRRQPQRRLPQRELL